MQMKLCNVYLLQFMLLKKGFLKTLLQQTNNIAKRFDFMGFICIYTDKI